MADARADGDEGLPRRVLIAASALQALIVAAASAAVIAVHGFDGLYGQDAFAYVGYALGPLSDALSRGQLPPPFFWPPAYPLLVAVAAGLGIGEQAGQVVALVCGALLPILVVLMAREVLHQRYAARRRDAVALLAGLATALAGHLWQSSVVAMADTTGAAFATAGAWTCARFWRTGTWPVLAVSAAAFAVAIQARWIYGLVALPFVVLALWRIVRDWRADRRAALAALVGGTVAALITLGPTLVPVVGALASGQPVPFVGDFGVYSWNPLGAFSTTFETPDGRLQYQLPTGLFYLLQPLQPYWLAALGILALPGLVLIARRTDPASAAALLAWPLLVVGFHIGGAYQNTRFFLATLPPLAILAAVGVQAVRHALLARSPPSRRAVVERFVVLAVVGALAVNASLALRFTNGFVERQSADLEAIRSLAQRVPAGARLIALGATTVLEHDGHDALELWGLAPDAARSLVADGRPSYVLVDADAVRTQFAGLAAGRAFAALESDPGLASVASAGIWTLYVVGR